MAVSIEHVSTPSGRAFRLLEEFERTFSLDSFLISNGRGETIWHVVPEVYAPAEGMEVHGVFVEVPEFARPTIGALFQGFRVRGRTGGPEEVREATVTYGVVPTGFKQTEPKPPDTPPSLAPGKYRAVAVTSAGFVSCEFQA